VRTPLNPAPITATVGRSVMGAVIPNYAARLNPRKTSPDMGSTAGLQEN
jgi:hypothetical protein